MLAAQAQAGILDASRADKPVCGGRGADSLGSHLNFRNILSMVFWAWKMQMESESITSGDLISALNPLT